MRSESIVFPNARGEPLAAKLDLPIDGEPIALALFAHCFTCSKNFKAVARLSEELTLAGIGVLRFDFTGLGESAGDFSTTHLSSNVADLLAAARFLTERHGAPQLLIGHSLGGAAVLQAAAHLPAVKAVATIAAPFDPAHVFHLLRKHWTRMPTACAGMIRRSIATPLPTATAPSPRTASKSAANSADWGRS